MFNRLNFDIENQRVKSEVATSIKFILEEKFQLEQQIRAGRDAERKLRDLESKLVINMTAYLAIKEKTI